MYLNLLELIYAVQDGEIVKTWLSQIDRGSVLISTEQYDEEMLVVLAADQALTELYIKLRLCPAVSSCKGKRRAVYRVVTTLAPAWMVLKSFPLCEGEEWYQCNENTAYLCKLHQFSDEQISWLAACRHIARWECFFDLVPVPLDL